MSRRRARRPDLAHITGTGVDQEVGGEQLLKMRNRMAREEAAAKAEGRHLWVATIAHVVSDYAIRHLDEPLILDTESMLSDPALGCFRCEQTFHPRLLDTPCPGDPS